MLALALLLQATAGSAAPPASIAVNERLDYYSVSGRDGAALRAALNRSGPIGADGRRYDGYTRLSLSWSYDDLSDGHGSCMFTTRKIVVDAQMTLPQWQPGPDASSALQHTWARYLQALRTHEEGHVEIGRGVAQKLDAMMREMPAQPDCPTLDRELQARGKQILQANARQDADYDQRTRHGQTQGAVFP